MNGDLVSRYACSRHAFDQNFRDFSGLSFIPHENITVFSKVSGCAVTCFQSV